MPVELNHTIAHAEDGRAAAEWVAEILGLAAPQPFGPFWVVELANGASLDFMDKGGWDMPPQHYAFLVSEEEFDQIFGRIVERGIEHWADPHKSTPNEINHHDGGRGVYFEEPDGKNLLEIITRPYGSGGLTL